MILKSLTLVMMSTSKGEITPPCYYKLVTKLWMQVKFDETGGKEISRKDFFEYTFPQHLIQFGDIEKYATMCFFPTLKISQFT